MNTSALRRLKIFLILSLALTIIGCTKITGNQKQYVKNNTQNNVSLSNDTLLTEKTNQDTAELYLKIVNSGIVCITTPCPYYKAQLINAAAEFNFDELSFTKTNLSPEQEAQARQLLVKKGLIVTAEKYESEGKTGKGVGLSITKIFSPVDTEQ